MASPGRTGKHTKPEGLSHGEDKEGLGPEGEMLFVKQVYREGGCRKGREDHCCKKKLQVCNFRFCEDLYSWFLRREEVRPQ